MVIGTVEWVLLKSPPATLSVLALRSETVQGDAHVEPKP